MESKLSEWLNSLVVGLECGGKIEIDDEFIENLKRRANHEILPDGSFVPKKAKTKPTLKEIGKQLDEEESNEMSKLTFEKLQIEHISWSQSNFPDMKAYQCLLGIFEEVGELSHAHLKREQGIRGTEQEHLERAKDAIGDIVIFLAGYCSKMGFDFQKVVAVTWTDVRMRDYIKDKLKDGNEKT